MVIYHPHIRLGKRWYTGLALWYASLGSRVQIPIIRYTLTVWLSGQRLLKLLPYCPQTGLTTFICV